MSRRQTVGVVVDRAAPATGNGGPVEEHRTASQRGHAIQRSIAEDSVNQFKQPTGQVRFRAPAAARS